MNYNKAMIGNQISVQSKARRVTQAHYIWLGIVSGSPVLIRCAADAMRIQLSDARPERPPSISMQSANRTYVLAANVMRCQCKQKLRAAQMSPCRAPLLVRLHCFPVWKKNAQQIAGGGPFTLITPVSGDHALPILGLHQPMNLIPCLAWMISLI